MTSSNQKEYQITDLSGGTQSTTTQFQVKANQFELSSNASFKRVGGVEKIKGYTQLGNTITSSTTSSSSTSSTTSSTSSTTSSTSSTSSTTSTTTSTSSSTSTSTSTSSTTTP